MFEDEQTVVGSDAFDLRLERTRDRSRRLISNDCDALFCLESQTDADGIAGSRYQLKIGRIRIGSVRHKRRVQDCVQCVGQQIGRPKCTKRERQEALWGGGRGA